MRLLPRLNALSASGDLHDEFRATWHQLEIRAQPIHRTRDSAVVAAEALLRWRRNPHELWAAAMVMPLAEDSGRIEELTSWATELSMTVWSTSRHRAAGARLALNLHRTQLSRPRIADELAMAARFLEIAPNELILEIPDQLGPDACRDAVDRLGHLVEAGALLALDNHRGAAGRTTPRADWFPRGSLVKLDPDLTYAADDPTGREVLAQTVAELHGEGYLTVAEAVERPEQLEAVVGCDIPLAQGYLFGKPQPLV